MLRWHSPEGIGGKSKTERIDIENPAPGERPGQIHYHEPNNTKWYLDVNEMKFYNQKTGGNGTQKYTKDIKKQRCY